MRDHAARMMAPVVDLTSVGQQLVDRIQDRTARIGIVGLGYVPADRSRLRTSRDRDCEDPRTELCQRIGHAEGVRVVGIPPNELRPKLTERMPSQHQDNRHNHSPDRHPELQLPSSGIDTASPSRARETQRPAQAGSTSTARRRCDPDRPMDTRAARVARACGERSRPTSIRGGRLELPAPRACDAGSGARSPRRRTARGSPD